MELVLSALKSVNLTIPNLSDADWNRIDTARERLLTNVTDFVYIGPNDFESSGSGSSTESADDDDDDDDDAEDLPQNLFPEIILNGNHFEVHVSDDENDEFIPPRNVADENNNDVNDDDDHFLL